MQNTTYRVYSLAPNVNFHADLPFLYLRPSGWELLIFFFFKLENVRQLKLHHLSQWITDGLESFIVCFQHAYSQHCKQTAELLGDSVAFIWL